jgi:hypothetical protein
MREEPAIYAWKSFDPTVEIRSVDNIENAGAKTVFYLGYKVTDLGGGRWSYEYAIQNLTSDQSAGSYSVPVHPDSLITDIGFHDVAYHSGDPYDGTNWPGLRNGGEVRWATVPFNTNVNANAIRWGTLYNFRFTANSGPVRGPVTIGLFKPSVNTDIQVPDVWVPMDPPAHGHVRQSSPPSGPVGGPVIVPLVATPRHGSGANPPILAELSPAVIGGTWRAGIQLDTALETVLFLSPAGPAQGTTNRMGEILIQPPSQVLAGDTLELAIPNEARLIGATFSAQAAVRTESGWHLTNALDVTIGKTE